MKRRGVVLLAALVALLVAMLMVSVVARRIVQLHREMRMEQQRQQAFWFAESAVQRAAIQLRKSPDYSGESWHAMLETNGRALEGVADIRVEAVPDAPDQRTIVIEARWPDVPVDRVLEQRRRRIDLTSMGDST